MLANLKPHLEQLCDLAAQKSDPVEVAKLTVSLLTPALMDQLAELIADKEKFKLLGLLAPRMQEFADWFEVLRTALEAELFESDGPSSISIG